MLWFLQVRTAQCVRYDELNYCLLHTRIPHRIGVTSIWGHGVVSVLDWAASSEWCRLVYGNFGWWLSDQKFIGRHATAHTSQKAILSRFVPICALSMLGILTPTQLVSLPASMQCRVRLDWCPLVIRVPSPHWNMPTLVLSWSSSSLSWMRLRNLWTSSVCVRPIQCSYGF